MKNEEQQKAPEGEKELAKEIQEKAFKGGQNAVTTYKSNLQAPEAPKIELPKGGGALRSIGEKFEANPVTGTANISVPIAISPGRNGFQPELSLSYSSGGGNGIFGMGWGVGFGSISRKTQKGLPLYDDANESDVYIFAGVEDLVPVSDANGTYRDATEAYTIQRYQPRIEGSFLKIERWTKILDGDIHWRVTDKGNTTSILGESPTARIYDSADTKRISEWKIERKYDALGNCIQYDYYRENDTNIDNGPAEYNRLSNGTAFNQLYPRSIQYGNSEMYGSANWNANTWHFEVVFNYGDDHNNYPTGVTNENIQWPQRPDAFSSFRTGFEVRTYRLCQKVLMYHHFDVLNNDAPLLVKSTEITYDENKVGCQIQEVQHKGYDDTSTGSVIGKEFPPVSFSYSKAVPNSKIYTLKNSDVENLPYGIDGQNYSFSDPKGEGINGILTESANAWYFKPNLGHDNFYKDHPADYSPEPIGSFGSLETLNQKPLGANPASLQDIDGDGKPEAVIREPHMAGYYKQKDNGEWGAFHYFDGYPNLDFQSEDIKFLDLNGDGRADILITKQDTLEWIAYEDNDVSQKASNKKVKPGYGKTNVISRALDEEQGPRVVFSNGQQNIFLSDMTGDGFSDLVRIENGSIAYWPNKGFGHFGAKIILGNVPTFDYADQFTASRIRLGDIDGSGTTDILYLGSKTTTYFINQAGNALADGIVLDQFPTKDDTQNVQLADILGNGTSCLVWSSAHEKDKPHHIKYMDLMGGEKPYLLEEMDNGTGALRKFSYSPSTKFYLRDKKAGNPWITKLSFPVQTLERVEVFEQITQSRFVTRYAYHHGYFDPIEKEFRGFGMVEQWDTEAYEQFTEPALYQVGVNALDEQSHSEPVYTKTWFHNGYYEQKQKIENHYATEYWNGDALAFPVSENTLPANLPVAELTQAYRALKGSALRQEVYGLNAQGESGIPYSVSQSRYKVLRVQDQGANRFGVFRTELQESFSYSYEQDADDARVGHQILLESDAYGTPTKTATIAYPRRGTGHNPEQLKGHIVIGENSFIHVVPVPTDAAAPATHRILADTQYRIGVGSSEKVWEYRPQAFIVPMNAATLLSEFTAANEIAIEAEFLAAGDEKKLITKANIAYYNEALTAALSVGSIASHALPHHTERIAFTDNLIDEIYNETGVTRLDAATAEGQTILTEAGYVQNGTEWWIPSGTMLFDATNFYLPQSSVDIFGNQTDITYDDFNLLPVQITDPLNNVIVSENNYVHLQPTLMTDPNGNQQKVVLDALGMPVKMLVMGKASTHPNYSRAEGDTEADPGTVYEYDLFQFQNHQKPNYSKVIQREYHITDPNGNNETRTDISFTDGLGKTIQTRSQFGEYAGTNNSDTEVVVSGRQIMNNKDLVIEQFEPYFEKGFEYIAHKENAHNLNYEECGNALESFIATHGESELSNTTLLQSELNTILHKNLTATDYYQGLKELNLVKSEVSLNGESDIDFGDHSHLHFGAGDYTVEAWIKPDNVQGLSTILSTQKFASPRLSGFALYIINGVIGYYLADSSGSYNNGVGGLRLRAAIPVGSWTHVVISRSGNDPRNWETFVNGVSVTTHSILDQMGDGNINTIAVESLKIGSRRGSANATNNYYSGTISGLRLYDRALNAIEAQANFSVGEKSASTVTNGLVFSAPLDESETTSFADTSSYGLTGTVVGNNSIIKYTFNTDWAANLQPNLARIRMQYDVLGRNTRIDYDDGTFEKVEFDAWQQKNYDRNDTVVDSQWYADRNSPDLATAAPTNSEERAAWLSAKHYNTPSVIEMDSLGRVFKSRSDNGSFDGTSTAHVYYDIHMQMSMDGKQQKVTNALNQDTVFKHNLLPTDREGNSVITYTDSPDGGWRRMLMDAVGNPLKVWDERGHVARSEYDELLRPTKSYVDEGTGEKLVNYILYGDSVPMTDAPEQANFRGQVIRSFDQSGMVQINQYDYKGNSLGDRHFFTTEYKTTVNWNSLTAQSDLLAIDGLAKSTFLEPEDDRAAVMSNTRTIYDALNRPFLMRRPGNNFNRFTYNKASLLVKVEQTRDYSAGFNEHVSNITYNAKGQRTNVYYANNSKTKHEYNPASFRLTRLLTTRNTGADILQDLNYTFDAVGNIVEQTDNAQQTQYFNNSLIAPKGTYEYDAVYRLTKATGREKESLGMPTNVMYTPDSLPTNGKSTAILRNYTEKYTYDDLGNITELIHTDTSTAGGSGSWTRNYEYSTGKPNNYLQSVYTGSTVPTTAQFTYDAHGNMAKMTHLPTMTWDFQDQLKSTVKGGETTYYVYSGGQRVRKVVENTGTNTAIRERKYFGEAEFYHKFDNAGVLEMERIAYHVSDDTGKVALLETKTLDNSAEIIMADQTTITRYQYSNHLGSASLELDEAAAILSYQEFHPFGSTSYSMHTNDSEVSMKRYKYNGKERDDETGLDYYGARYYASWLCRFISVDPQKDSYPMQNSFTYADNNPVTLMDINGEGTDGPGGEGDPDPFGTKITTPEGKTESHVEGLIPFLNDNGQTLGYIVPEGIGAGVYLWKNSDGYKGYFNENNKSFVDNYEDAQLKKDNPVGWVFSSAANIVGQGYIDFAGDPIGSIANTYEAIKNIPNIDVSKTIDHILGMDNLDKSKLLAIFAMGYLAGPKKFNLNSFKKSVMSFQRGKSTLNLISKSHLSDLVKNIEISSFSDIVENSVWLYGKTPEDVLKKLGNKWSIDSTYKSTTGGVRLKDGAGNFLSHNPGIPGAGSRHGGAKWNISGNGLEGKIAVGGADYSGFTFSANTKTPRIFNIIID